VRQIFSELSGHTFGYEVDQTSALGLISVSENQRGWRTDEALTIDVPVSVLSVVPLAKAVPVLRLLEVWFHAQLSIGLP